jgi:hypothetical protein
MVLDVLMAVVISVAAFAGTLLILAAIFRWQVRRYNKTVSTDLLNDWTMQLDLLDPADRKRALRSPPPNVVAAMVSLPAAGLRNGWTDSPLSSFDHQ